jgi:hypothetical protein
MLRVFREQLHGPEGDGFLVEGVHGEQNLCGAPVEFARRVGDFVFAAGKKAVGDQLPPGVLEVFALQLRIAQRAVLAAPGAGSGEDEFHAVDHGGSYVSLFMEPPCSLRSLPPYRGILTERQFFFVAARGEQGGLDQPYCQG